MYLGVSSLARVSISAAHEAGLLSSLAEKIHTYKKTDDRSTTLSHLQNLNEQFGDSITIREDFQWEWLYIPHFYHTPFYCYAHSFGKVPVVSLYQQYKLERRAFVPRYLKILAPGAQESRRISYGNQD